MVTVSDQWKAQFNEIISDRQLVEIEIRGFTENPLTDHATGTVSASGSVKGFSDLTSDTVLSYNENTPARYATFEENWWVLDGTYEMWDGSSADSEITGSSLSVTAARTNAKMFEAPGCAVVWDVIEGSYPKSFTMTVYYRAQGSTGSFDSTQTFTVTDNRSNISQVSFGAIWEVSSVSVTPSNWVTENHWARVHRIVPGLLYVYRDTDLIDYTHSRTMSYVNSELPSDTVSFNIYDPANVFGMTTAASRVLVDWLKNKRVIGRYGFQYSENTLVGVPGLAPQEWIDGGVWWIDSVYHADNSIQASFECSDITRWIRGNMFLPMYDFTRTVSAVVQSFEYGSSTGDFVANYIKRNLSNPDAYKIPMPITDMSAADCMLQMMQSKNFRMAIVENGILRWGSIWEQWPEGMDDYEDKTLDRKNFYSAPMYEKEESIRNVIVEYTQMSEGSASPKCISTYIYYDENAPLNSYYRNYTSMQRITDTALYEMSYTVQPIEYPKVICRAVYQETNPATNVPVLHRFDVTAIIAPLVLAKLSALDAGAYGDPTDASLPRTPTNTWYVRPPANVMPDTTISLSDMPTYIAGGHIPLHMSDGTYISDLIGFDIVPDTTDPGTQVVTNEARKTVEIDADAFEDETIGNPFVFNDGNAGTAAGAVTVAYKNHPYRVSVSDYRADPRMRPGDVMSAKNGNSTVFRIRITEQTLAYNGMLHGSVKGILL